MDAPTFLLQARRLVAQAFWPGALSGLLLSGCALAPPAHPAASRSAPVAVADSHVNPVASPPIIGGALTRLPPEIRLRYAARQKAAEGSLWMVDPVHSDVRAYAFRAGLGARFGHNHVLRLPALAGLAWFPDKGLRTGHADLAFLLDQIELDDPAVRGATGGSFARPLSSSDIAGTREHLLGDEGFQALRYPLVQVAVTIETGEAPIAIADVALTLHNETHHQRSVLHLSQLADAWELQGTLAFRQGDFGLRPYAVMGGLLAVDELVAVEFRLHLAALQQTLQ